ncbi:pectate lyase superfamily protein-domain-containing protein [Talaromyces proteolyticus]|uniref:Pectate lyase superfamily protein-domain-containing protein n=1 Tax=Talaromyces proteolyticus TaxID=1131652 RepID=A0AAD4KG97_9EURO|nr:pectate lyase superfamily protein-domain-containing protein [Talaromyces proteolyticus]KAH8690336.1 pectate lyase superfamily protein-domain-containing protein [Talaromyces proteolyticus]
MWRTKGPKVSLQCTNQHPYNDTAAINNAISSGGRCGEGCFSSTLTPAVVYFPAGTYLTSYPIFDYYFTEIIGNPNDLPVIKASSSFSGGWLIDGDPYFTPDPNWVTTDVFYRQIGHLVVDLRDISSNSSVSGIHWPTAQATSLQNLVFEMSTESGTKQQRLFIESGSGGYFGDLIFNGGNIGAGLGSQQFTTRNLTYNNAKTAISHFWNWGWTYKDININNCEAGIDMSSGNTSTQAVGSITVLDSVFTNTGVGIKTFHSASSLPESAGSVILENVSTQNEPIIVQGANNATSLAGIDGTIAGWGEGHSYTPDGPKEIEGNITPNTRPNSLVQGNGFYARSRPQYQSYSWSSFSSVRSGGATGNGKTDDTAALQQVINEATSTDRIVYMDAGTYLITSTLTIPASAKIVGEAYPVNMAAGSFFQDSSNPQAVVRVGNKGDSGQVEWSDATVSTQGGQAGTILIEWNLDSPANSPSGMWDVHTRVGGFTGSNLQTEQCLETPATQIPPDAPNAACIAAYMPMHITPEVSGLYMENVWPWGTDHDLDGNGQQITIYSDPDFHKTCAGKTGNCALGWGLRVVDSTDKLVYGAGLYSFFHNNDASCAAQSAAQNATTPCQEAILSVEGSSSAITIYNLNTISSSSMAHANGTSVANLTDHLSVFSEGIALFRQA